MDLRGRSPDGFTLVETMVAALLLVVGVLGAATLVNVASTQTANTTRRNGATNIARRVVEAARSVPASTVTSSNLTSLLQQQAPDLPNSSGGASWTVVRRGTTYTITPTVCTVDDPGDGIGVHDTSWCSNSSVTSPPDPQPADYRQVTVLVSWPGGGSATSRQVRQVADLPMASGSNVPTVTGLAMTSPFACSLNCATITSQSTTAASFAVTATNSPTSMTWLLDGNPQLTCPPTASGCSGSANAWAFTWNLKPPVKDMTTGSVNQNLCIAGDYTYDGVYQVGARVADANGLSGGTNSISVSLNRCAPIPPPQLNATGRNASTPVIDVEWEDNPEGDIAGYRVYKGTSTTSRTPVCPSSVSSGQMLSPDVDHACVDTSPPAYSSSTGFYYGVYAVDRDPSGNLREGALSFINVNTGNSPPNAPTSFAATKGTAGVTLTWSLPNKRDPDSGDTIDSFRIYRKNGTVTGSPTYVDRLDRDALEALCGTGTTCSYLDDQTGGTTHTYWITAVDTHLRESTYVGPKSA